MALVLGVGICLSLNIIGDGSTTFMILGIVIGIVGIAGVTVNYPIYRKILENSRKKYAADILALAGEIAYQVGYENTENFIRSFRKHNQKTPTEYRRSLDAEKQIV